MARPDLRRNHTRRSRPPVLTRKQIQRADATRSGTRVRVLTDPITRKAQRDAQRHG